MTNYYFTVTVKTAEINISSAVIYLCTSVLLLDQGVVEDQITAHLIRYTRQKQETGAGLTSTMKKSSQHHALVKYLTKP